MRITIHRGIDQASGCITEIATEQARILIDLGQNHPDGDGNAQITLANSEALARLTRGADAIFYTHFHPELLGLSYLVDDSVKQHIGCVAKRVALYRHQRLARTNGDEEQQTLVLSKLERMVVYKPKQPIVIADIKVTPYFVSHSAYDSYMFLVEAQGKRILHTGDFRGHGYIGKGLLSTVEKHVLRKGKVDFLITEATMPSCSNESVSHEHGLGRRALELMRQYRNVFVMCSSTDMERLATFYGANREMGGRPFICDDYQKCILDIFTETAGRRSPLFVFDSAHTFWKGNEQLAAQMQETGFCMLVRATEKFDEYLEAIIPRLDMDSTVLIYSMWKDYVNPNSKHAVKRYLDFVARFPVVKSMHSSGHASADCLARLCNLVNPRSGIVPMHAEQSTDDQKLPLKDELRAKVVTSSQTKDDVEVEIRTTSQYPDIP